MEAPTRLLATARTIAVALALLATLPAALPPGSAEGSVDAQFIQPGSEVETPIGFCTLNFVFRDAAGTLYVGTAGHCADRGHRVKTDGVAWGSVVLDLDDDADFALIKVDSSRYSQVRFDVRHWGGPTGYTRASETMIGEPLLLYGYGMVFGGSEPTRARQGALVGDSPMDYTADTLAVFGDSGGPLLVRSTGKALGIISSFNLPLTTDAGPTVEYLLKRAAQAGYSLTLQTAPLSGAAV